DTRRDRRMGGRSRAHRARRHPRALSPPHHARRAPPEGARMAGAPEAHRMSRDAAACALEADVSATTESARGLVPLRITARLMGPIVVSDPPVHLDALLTMAVAKREGRPPVCAPIDVLRAMREDPIALPLARSSCGRFYLATRM